MGLIELFYVGGTCHVYPVSCCSSVSLHFGPDRPVRNKMWEMSVVLASIFFSVHCITVVLERESSND